METVGEKNQNVIEDGILGGMSFDERTVEMVKRRSDKLAPDDQSDRVAGKSKGNLAAQIECATAKIPSATFFSLAVASIGISLLLRAFGRKNDSQFVGQWVPTILTVGLYNKIAKLEGSESQKAQRVQMYSADGRN